MNTRSTLPLLAGLATAISIIGPVRAGEAEAAWWNKEWTRRQPVTLDTSAEAAGISGNVSNGTLLLRLPYGAFQFDAARDNGADIRFVAADGKTVLPHQIESFDSGLGEGFVWVKVPEIKSGALEKFYLYYGNQDPALPATEPGTAYDAGTSLVYHFSGAAGPPVDSSANKNNAETAGSTALSAIVGNGLRVLPDAPVSIPNSPSLQWKAGQELTVSVWVKPDSLQDNAVILSRADGASSFRLLLNQGVPIVQTGSSRSEAAAALAPAVWSHLAVVSDGKALRLFVNGEPYSSLAGSLPALETPLTLGGLATPATGTNSFAGELDELTISSTARSDSWVKLAAVNQGSSTAG